MGPSDHALYSPMNITLSCKFEGTPLPSVTWTYLQVDGTTPLTLSSGDKYSIRDETESGSVYSNITTFLTLTVVSHDDAGSYTCAADNEVENLIGAQTNATSQLYFQENVEGRNSSYMHVFCVLILTSSLDPTLVKSPMSQVVVVETSTSLKCAAASRSNDLTIDWTKDGEPVSLPSLIERGVGVLRHDLRFPNVAVSDIGSYVCTASSAFRGMEVSSEAADLDVFSKPH